MVKHLTDVIQAGLHLNYAYKVDLFNDGNYEIVSPANVNSKTFNATVPFGRHRITWTIADGCGNFTTCSYIFWVKDCKKPTPVCHFLSGSYNAGTEGCYYLGY
ncbi:hypothetical protein MASR1M65_27820 [Saprospiraceae bacterium]